MGRTFTASERAASQVWAVVTVDKWKFAYEAIVTKVGRQHIRIRVIADDADDDDDNMVSVFPNKEYVAKPVRGGWSTTIGDLKVFLTATKPAFINEHCIGRA